jgi:hypothetical protein
MCTLKGVESRMFTCESGVGGARDWEVGVIGFGGVEVLFLGWVFILLFVGFVDFA